MAAVPVLYDVITTLSFAPMVFDVFKFIELPVPWLLAVAVAW